MTCPNHHPVPCREREFLMTEDPSPFMHDHMVRAHRGAGRYGSVDIVVGYLDGLGCPACGSFEPTENPDAHV